MKIIAFLLGTLALCAADNKTPPDLPAAVRPVVALARAAAPEVFAATVLHLIENGKIPEREQQIELLKDAFTAAAGAKEPVRLIAIPATPSDTRALYRSKAGEIGWDALSLQGRIVKDLLSIDAHTARELFDQIPRPMLDPRPCEDPLVADVSAYYEAASALAQNGFSAAERSKELHVQFLATILAGARSPNELAPFARAVEAVNLTPPQRELLSSALDKKLESIGVDYRAFAMSNSELAAALGRDPQLNPSYLAFVKNQLSGPRCQPDFPGLDAAGIQPASRGANFTADQYFQNGDDKHLGDALAHLRAMAGAPTVDTPDWRNQLADFLRDFAAWTPTGSSMDVFHQRATVFRALLEFVPPGDDRQRIVSLAVAFLQSSGAERDSPADWLYQVRMLANAVHQAAPMLDAFRASGSIGLALYATLGGF